ncbi:hypothetical protein [Hydrogenophaga sp.]|uniref:hypothetical protein n=1 Tax=Hydrogenophaga sp. TaxID=1904254 RepID=UPI0025BC1812|nr:hypothetical protein [Hydrogenophaga sp.]MBT9466232.1 hypothetical protein [Hydrogenophaga sp.]
MDSIFSPPDASWIQTGHLLTPIGLRLSFQRFERSEDGQVPQPLPSSLGALPCALGRDGSLLIPLALDEAFWIGMQPDDSMPAVRLTLFVVSEEVRAAPLPVVVNALGGRINGYPDSTGQVLSFAREHRSPSGARGCSRLECSIVEIAGTSPAAACRFALRLVDPVAFTRESGRPAPSPIDPATGYREHLLP